MSDNTHDLSIIYASDGQDWAVYFQGLFINLDVDVYCVSINDVADDNVQEEIKKSKSQLLLLTPQMLEKIQQNHFKNVIVNPVAATVLFMSVLEEEIVELNNNFPDYSKWNKLFMPEDADEKLVRTNILLKIVAVFEKAAQTNRAPAPAVRPKPRPKPKTQEIKAEDVAAASFVLVEPKKFTHEESNTIVLIVKKREEGQKFEREKVRIVLEHDSVCIPLNFTKHTSFTFIATIPKGTPAGSYSLKFYLDEKCHAMQTIEVLSHRIADDLLLEALYRTINPVQLMCEALHINPKNLELLDEKLREMFEAKFPNEVTRLCTIFDVFEPGDIEETSDKELPTLLHFAAKYGLEKFCMKLLDCPGAKFAYSIENVNHDYPQNLAQKSGFTDLAKYLEDWLEMAPLLDVMKSTYVCVTSSREVKLYANSPPSVCPSVDTYVPAHMMSTNDDTYMPFDQYVNTVNHGTGQPIYKNEGADGYDKAIDTEGDYMSMGNLRRNVRHTVEPVEDVIYDEALDHQQEVQDTLYLETDFAPKLPERSKSTRPPRTPSLAESPEREIQTLPRSYKPGVGGIMAEPPPPAKPTESQSENNLIEINRGVATGEYTIDEAVQLFNAWNQQPKGSLKERQKMLQIMREEYSQVLNSVEQQAERRGGVFGRLFRRKKKSSAAPPPSVEQINPTIAKAADEYNAGRPSSTSSSRSSTASNGSVGRDSGSFSGADDLNTTANYNDECRMSPIEEVEGSRGVQRTQSTRKISQVERLSLRQEALLRYSDLTPDAPPPLPVRGNRQSIPDPSPMLPPRSQSPPTVPTRDLPRRGSLHCHGSDETETKPSSLSPHNEMHSNEPKTRKKSNPFGINLHESKLFQRQQQKENTVKNDSDGSDSAESLPDDAPPPPPLPRR